MMAFLLRFQEQCDAAPAAVVCTGTQTHTYVRTEQGDSDPRHYDFRSLPIAALGCPSVMSAHDANLTVLSGTKTETAVRQESTDDDPMSSIFDTVPKVPPQ